MRYTTPTVPMYRMVGTRTQTTGPCPGPYPVYKLVGYVPGVPVPNPRAPLPKHGHWRISPRAKLRSKPRQHVVPMWRSNVGPMPDYSNASLRARVRAAVAAGQIAPQHAPSWAQPQG